MHSARKLREFMIDETDRNSEPNIVPNIVWMLNTDGI